MDRVLITGGTGFVGRHLGVALAERGHALTVAGRTPPLESSPGARLVSVGSIGADTEWADALAGADAVVHLAAHVHVAPERAAREADLFDRVNRDGSLRLYQAAAEAGAKLFVFLSSITVLGGESPAGRPLDDRSKPAPGTPYARSKLAAEEALRARAGEGGPTLVILRPPLICGPGVKGNLRALGRLAASPLPLPLGGLRNRRTLLSLVNLAGAVSAVLDRPAPGTFVLGDASPLSTSDIVRHLRDGAGRPARLLPVPAEFASALAGLAGRREITRRLFGDLEVDSRGFRTAFGWSDAVDTASALREVGADIAGRALSRRSASLLGARRASSRGEPD